MPAEQGAIAEALSDVDGLLGALEALIAKKRAIKQAAMQHKTRAVKQGMMQHLLTGRVRLVKPEMAAGQTAGHDPTPHFHQ